MSDGPGSSFGTTFLGALEGSIAVLLTLFVGYLVARKGMIDRPTVHKVSNICSMLFLPCLIVMQMGPELTAGQLKRLWILPLWGLVSTIIAHAIGYIGYRLFNTRAWLIVAAGRPNTSALPLLLLQSLSTTGVLDQFSNDGESSARLLSRAQSLILLNVVVQQTITFQVAPWLLKHDRKAEGKPIDEDEEDVEHGPATLAPEATNKHCANLNLLVQNSEQIGLLADHDGRDYGTSRERESVEYTQAMEPIADQPDIRWPKSLGFLERPIKRTSHAMSPPLIGAVIALIIGVSTNLVLYAPSWSPKVTF